MAIGLALGYKDKVLKIHPESLIAYYPLHEQQGTTAKDYSLQANHDTYSGVTLAHDTGADGLPAPYFDGTSSYVDIYSAAFAADFSTTTGSASAWVRVLDKTQLENTTRRCVLSVGANATTNVVLMERTTTANTYRLAYIAGGTTKSVSPTYYQPGDYEIPWIHIGCSWDATNDQFIVYVNGVQSGTTQTSLGTWSGSLDSTLCNIGATVTTPSNVWYGWIQHVAIWNAVLSADDFKRLGTME